LLESAIHPFFSSVMSKFTMSPSTSTSVDEGTPWQTTWFGDELIA